MITLKRPIKEYESKAAAFKQEFIDNGEATINGSELLDQMDSYDENDSIVGIIDLRHELNDFLKSGLKQNRFAVVFFSILRCLIY